MFIASIKVLTLTLQFLFFLLLKGQPAIDSGGVLRQVFSDLFYAMANNEGIKIVFNGDKNSKVPAFSNELVVNGLFEVLGKMIAYRLQHISEE